MKFAFVSDIFLPLCLVAIMFGMGTGLKKQDFVRLAKAPKPILGGVMGQFLLLPTLAFFICIGFDLPAKYAIGLMIIGACPGGTLSNAFSQICKANLALSVSLTAIGSIMCIVTAPLIITGSIAYFDAGGMIKISLIETSLSVLAISVLPVSAGMMFARCFPHQAEKMQPFFRYLSAIVMGLMVIAVLMQQHDALKADITLLVIAALLMHALATFGGLWIANVFGLDKGDRTTVGIEVGIQNASMAVVISMTILATPELAVPATVYGLVMFIGGTILSVRNKTQKLQQAY